MKPNADLYWDNNIQEFEVDSSWKEHPIFKTKEYLDYREKFKKASKGEYLGKFPLNIELEPTYYCNLKCPYCPRTVNSGERSSEHMKSSIWDKILKECSDHKMPSKQMDHEAESMMNPKFFDILKQTTDAGIFDTWLHTNAQMLTEKNGEKLKKEEKNIVGYGVPAKFATLFHVLGLNPEFFDYLVDDNELKQGCYGPGTALLIKSVNELARNIPDYIFLFSWNYREQITGKILENYLVSEGIIIPLPELLVKFL